MSAEMASKEAEEEAERMQEMEKEQEKAKAVKGGKKGGGGKGGKKSRSPSPKKGKKETDSSTGTPPRECSLLFNPLLTGRTQNLKLKISLRPNGYQKVMFYFEIHSKICFEIFQITILSCPIGYQKFQNAFHISI